MEPFEVRPVDTHPEPVDGAWGSTLRQWVRCTTPLGDDPVKSAAALAYVSDMGAGGAVLPRPAAARRDS